jgi:hypothetical protein
MRNLKQCVEDASRRGKAEKPVYKENHDHESRDHEVKYRFYQEIMIETDIINFVNSNPVCKVAIRWGVYPQALTNAVKQYGPERVVTSIRFTATYPAAKNKAAFFFSVLRNGIKERATA